MRNDYEKLIGKYIGDDGVSEALEKIKADLNLNHVRFIIEGSIITMEARADRLTITIDENDIITDTGIY